MKNILSNVFSYAAVAALILLLIIILQFLGREDPLEKGKATQSSILA